MNKGNASPSRRTYSSKLREEQAEQTRDRILAGLCELLGSSDVDDISIASIAQRSGVSVPTVYRYFPSRKDLFDAMEEWISKELKAPPFPESWEKLAEGSRELFEYYEKGRDLFRAAMVTALFSDVNRTNRVSRDKRIVKLLAPLTGHLEARDANAVHALVRLLYSFESYEFMIDRFGVTAAEANHVVSLAIRTLLAQIESTRVSKDAPRRNGKSSPSKPVTKTGETKRRPAK